MIEEYFAQFDLIYTHMRVLHVSSDTVYIALRKLFQNQKENILTLKKKDSGCKMLFPVILPNISSENFY